PRSVSGVMRRGRAAAASDPREIGAVGKISAIWQNVQPTWSAVCQLSRVTGKGGRLAVEPITTARHSLRHRGSCRDGRCLGISAGQRQPRVLAANRVDEMAPPDSYRIWGAPLPL